MNIDSLMEEFKADLDKVLERVLINFICCFSNRVEVEKWTFSKYEKYLGKDKNHKITVDSALPLNRIDDPNLLTDIAENKDLIITVSRFKKFAHEKIGGLSKAGKNLYDINQLMRDAFKAIEERTILLNYESWLKEKNVLNSEDILFLVTKNESRTYSGIYFDFSPSCRYDLENSFAFRINLLNEIKYGLVATYSKYLLLPNPDILPTIKYTCSGPDICILIKALAHTNYIVNNHELKAILLQLFGLNERDFSKNTSEFNRKKIATRFTKEIITSISPPGYEIVKLKKD